MGSAPNDKRDFTYFNAKERKPTFQLWQNNPQNENNRQFMWQNKNDIFNRIKYVQKDQEDMYSLKAKVDHVKSNIKCAEEELKY